MAAPADHNSTSRDEIILPPSNHPYVIKVTGTNYFCDIIRGNNVSNDILNLCYTTNPPHPVAIYTTAKFNNVDFDYNRQRETLWSNYTIPTTTTFGPPTAPVAAPAVTRPAPATGPPGMSGKRVSPAARRLGRWQRRGCAGC